MEVYFKPEIEAQIYELASATGRDTGDVVQDAVASYLSDLAEVRAMLSQRYDDFVSGQVEAVDGEEFFDRLRLHAEKLSTFYHE